MKICLSRWDPLWLGLLYSDGRLLHQCSPVRSWMSLSNAMTSCGQASPHVIVSYRWYDYALAEAGIQYTVALLHNNCIVCRPAKQECHRHRSRLVRPHSSPPSLALSLASAVIMYLSLGVDVFCPRAHLAVFLEVRPL